MRVFEDIRFGIRTLAKSPSVTIVSVLTLALGIGVNATVFTLSNAVLFKGFPFDNSDRILYLGEHNATRNQRYGPVSYPDLRDWRARVKSFAGLAAANGFRVNLSPERPSGKLPRRPHHSEPLPPDRPKARSRP